MEKYLEILRKNKLFYGISNEDLLTVLACLDTKLRHFKRGDFIFREGEKIDYLTILVDGSLYIQRDDYWGNRSIINTVTAGEMFGEAYIAPESGPILNDVIAIEDSDILFFDIKKMLSICSETCRFHIIILQNLFFAISETNKKLVQKLELMSRRSTREKLFLYLSSQARKADSNSFTIPFNRQQLADFLSVDRSAMSSELAKMKKDRLLTFDKNHFILY